MAACDSVNQCPTEPFDSAWIEVLCSDAAIEMVDEVGNEGRAIVEYRQDPQDAWIECYDAGGIEPRFCALGNEDEKPHLLALFIAQAQRDTTNFVYGKVSL